MRQPKSIPYFCAAGMSSRPKVARTSSKDPMEVMEERACLSLSRSDISLLKGTAGFMIKFAEGGVFEEFRGSQSVLSE